MFMLVSCIYTFVFSESYKLCAWFNVSCCFSSISMHPFSVKTYIPVFVCLWVIFFVCLCVCCSWCHVLPQVEVWLGQGQWGGPLHRPPRDQCRDSVPGHQSCNVWGAGLRWQCAVWSATGNCGRPQILHRGGEYQSGSPLFHLCTDLTKKTNQNCHAVQIHAEKLSVFYSLDRWIKGKWLV